MVEVIWVALFGAALAWLQAQSSADETRDAPMEAEVPVDDEWRRWEQEIYEWRDQ